MSAEIIVGLAKALDCFSIAAAGLLAYALYVANILGGTTIILNYLTAIALGAFLFTVGCQLARGYGFARLANLRWQVWHAAVVWAGVLLVFLMAAFLLKISDNYSRGWLLLWAVLAMAFVIAGRAALWSMMRVWAREGRLVKTVAILGGGGAASRLAARLEAAEERIEILGVFADEPASAEALIELAHRQPIDEIVIALPLHAVEAIGRLVQKLSVLPVDLRLSAEAMQAAFPVCGIGQIGGVAVIKLADRPLKHWNAVLKWLEDKIIGAMLLILLAPLMAAAALLVRWDSRGPVFFIQERFGFDNNIIRVVKFRTMFVEGADQAGRRATVRGDPRVTRVGRILRRSSIDELPQLLNVLKGEMSLVGPRAHPLGMRIEDRLYDDVARDYPCRHRVKPGVTGWAQINGLRGEVDTIDKAEARLRHDLYYIDNWSVWLDLKILLLSLREFFNRKNAY